MLDLHTPKKDTRVQIIIPPIRMKFKVCRLLLKKYVGNSTLLVNGTTWGVGAGRSMAAAMDAAARKALDYGDRTGAFEKL